MPWKYNSVTIREGRAWTDDNGYQHPTNWSSVWDAKTKADRGLVWEDVQAPFDSRFYSGRDDKGNLIEKALQMHLWLMMMVRPSLMKRQVNKK